MTSYSVILYHDSMRQFRVYEDTREDHIEEYCRALFFQLRAMGAKGEIRVAKRTERRFENILALEQKQYAFVNLYDSEYKYVVTA